MFKCINGLNRRFQDIYTCVWKIGQVLPFQFKKRIVSFPWMCLTTPRITQLWKTYHNNGGSYYLIHEYKNWRYSELAQ